MVLLHPGVGDNQVQKTGAVATRPTPGLPSGLPLVAYTFPARHREDIRASQFLPEADRSKMLMPEKEKNLVN